MYKTATFFLKTQINANKFYEIGINQQKNSTNC